MLFKLLLKTVFVATMIQAQILTSQTTADFEDYNLVQDTFLNGSLGEQGFTNGHIFLPNSYDDAWGTWSGWSISSMTDNETPGFTNQYSSIAGGGADDSPTYATGYVFDPVMINMTDAGIGILEGMFVSNSTYGYLSMRDGDAFAKKFGGITGDDPDFLLLTIKRWWMGITIEDDVSIYLADFRFDDPNEDYILDDWAYVSFDEFKGNVDSVELVLTSSDVGMFGMNTPAYICIDNFTTSDTQILSANDIQQEPLHVYPNPVQDRLNIEIEASSMDIKIINAIGRKVSQFKTNDHWIDVGHLVPGQYVLEVQSDRGRSLIQFIKK